MKYFYCKSCGSIKSYAQAKARIDFGNTLCGKCKLEKLINLREIQNIQCFDCPVPGQGREIYDYIIAKTEDGLSLQEIFLPCCNRVAKGNVIIKNVTKDFGGGRGPRYITYGDYHLGVIPLEEEEPALANLFAQPDLPVIKQGEYVMKDVEEIKPGTDLIDIQVKRGLRGITVHVKAHQIVESFMSAISHGKIRQLGDLDNTWASAQPEQPLQIYNINYNLATQDYQLNLAGGDLFQGNVLNLSFLKLKGISDEDGVTFNLTTPINRDQFKRLEGMLLNATTNFYRDFIKPMNLSVSVSAG